ncbi:HutD family protein [Allorhizobium sp. BGMRC 0089]|nr:HutD family protein [Allorhizobium sonneratiae]
MTLLRPQDYRSMPWKNGMGVTIEIAVFPEGAALDAFDWRISMASVVEDGAFSCFTGIDRTLSILDGAGLELAVAGEASVQLTRTTKPHRFPADSPTHARLLDGPVTDFNVMTRRGACDHHVEVLETGHHSLMMAQADTILAYCFRGEATIGWNGTEDALAMGETARIEAETNGPLSLTVSDGGKLFVTCLSISCFRLS